MIDRVRTRCCTIAVSTAANTRERDRRDQRRAPGRRDPSSTMSSQTDDRDEHGDRRPQRPDEPRDRASSRASAGSGASGRAASRSSPRRAALPRRTRTADAPKPRTTQRATAVTTPATRSRFAVDRSERQQRERGDDPRRPVAEPRRDRECRSSTSQTTLKWPALDLAPQPRDRAEDRRAGHPREEDEREHLGRRRGRRRAPVDGSRRRRTARAPQELRDSARSMKRRPAPMRS